LEAVVVVEEEEETRWGDGLLVCLARVTATFDKEVHRRYIFTFLRTFHATFTTDHR
jgi:hypothetical protein